MTLYGPEGSLQMAEIFKVGQTTVAGTCYGRTSTATRVELIDQHMSISISICGATEE
jgi:hypothetical protein